MNAAICVSSGDLKVYFLPQMAGFVQNLGVSLCFYWKWGLSVNPPCQSGAPKMDEKSMYKGYFDGVNLKNMEVCLPSVILEKWILVTH